MAIAIDGQFLGVNRPEILFDDRRLLSEVEVLVEPLVHRLPRDAVVVMAELREHESIDVVGRTRQRINLLQFRQTPCGAGGSSHPLPSFPSAWRKQGCDRHVADSDPQVVHRFAHAAPLHAGRHHHGGKGDRRARSIAHNRKVCVPPPLAPVTPIRLLSTSGSESKKSSGGWN